MAVGKCWRRGGGQGQNVGAQMRTGYSSVATFKGAQEQPQKEQPDGEIRRGQEPRVLVAQTLMAIRSLHPRATHSCCVCTSLASLAGQLLRAARVGPGSARLGEKRGVRLGRPRKGGGNFLGK